MDSKSSFKLMIGKSDFSNKKIFGDKPKKVFDYYLMSFKSFYGYSKYFCPENRINFNFILRKANISKILNLFINLLILLILSPTLLQFEKQAVLKIYYIIIMLECLKIYFMIQEML